MSKLRHCYPARVLSRSECKGVSLVTQHILDLHQWSHSIYWTYINGHTTYIGPTSIVTQHMLDLHQWSHNLYWTYINGLTTYAGPTSGICMVSRMSHEYLVGPFDIYHEYIVVFFARIVAVGRSGFYEMNLSMTWVVSDRMQSEWCLPVLYSLLT